MNRRRFLAAAAAATATGVVREHAWAAEKSKLLLPSDTPDDLGFRLMWYNPVPPIDPARYRLKVHGLVEQPREIPLERLRKLDRETQSSRMKCVQCWSSRTSWSGFRAPALFDVVKPRKSARAARIECADKWYEYFSMEDLLSPRLLFALEMAGQPLADRHGAPLRMVDPKRYGYKSAKLITSIEFVSEGKGSMACDIGPYYSPGGEIKPGYDTPLDLGGKLRKKIAGGEIVDY